ncbi:hypothetical protein [Streptomyces misionensis]|uniref:hypothetical protein n=1 Tax=Streptomyces misionensis TaxID=67331 RepID=UPI00313433E7
MNAGFEPLGHLPTVAVYAVVATAVLAESVLLVGAVIPTLPLLLTAGALARTGHISLPLVSAVAAGAVVTGDFLAHRTGRVGRRIPPVLWARAETLMGRHGGRAGLPESVQSRYSRAPGLCPAVCCPRRWQRRP